MITKSLLFAKACSKSNRNFVSKVLLNKQKIGFELSKNTNKTHHQLCLLYSSSINKNETLETLSSKSSAEVKPNHDAQNKQKNVGCWFLFNALLVFGIVLVGGFTRLTESGLSITEWNLIKGIKPPKSDKDWEAEFGKYKQSPEYQQINRDIDLDKFKVIYYTEYIHRLYGRFIGLTYILPAIYFWKRQYFTTSMKKRVFLFGSLLSFQGFLGWYMVKSGLKLNSKDDTARVSQYRLAAHLGTAFILYAMLLYNGIRLVDTNKILQKNHQMPLHLVAGFVFLTAMSGFVIFMLGAFVAGLDAGFIYNDFPKMGNSYIPPKSELYEERFNKQIWKNYFENPVLVQLVHRTMAVTTFSGVAILVLYSKYKRLPKVANLGMNMLLGVTTVQAALGISTLLYVVPTSLGVMHQAGSLSVLSCIVWLMHILKKHGIR